MVAVIDQVHLPCGCGYVDGNVARRFDIRGTLHAD
jgi:hypothetical protein